MQTDGEEDDDSDDEVDKGCGDDCDSCDDGSDDERQRGRVCTKTEPKSALWFHRRSPEHARLRVV